MAVPKKKISKSRKKTRLNHSKSNMTFYRKCQKCNKWKENHNYCINKH